MKEDIPDTPEGFEASLHSLETLVNRLENEPLSLEESLEEYQRGLLLVRSCQNALEEAQQRIENLLIETSSVKKQSLVPKDHRKVQEIMGKNDNDAPF